MHNAINADRMNRIWRSREITRKTRKKYTAVVYAMYKEYACLGDWFPGSNSPK